jgi:hypothetical protein
MLHSSEAAIASAPARKRTEGIDGHTHAVTIHMQDSQVSVSKVRAAHRLCALLVTQAADTEICPLLAARHGFTWKDSPALGPCWQVGMPCSWKGQWYGCRQLLGR